LKASKHATRSLVKGEIVDEKPSVVLGSAKKTTEGLDDVVVKDTVQIKESPIKKNGGKKKTKASVKKDEDGALRAARRAKKAGQGKAGQARAAKKHAQSSFGVQSITFASVLPPLVSCVSCVPFADSSSSRRVFLSVSSVIVLLFACVLCIGEHHAYPPFSIRKRIFNCNFFDEAMLLLISFQFF
jgi:hypothetical protein